MDSTPPGPSSAAAALPDADACTAQVQAQGAVPIYDKVVTKDVMHKERMVIPKRVVAAHMADLADQQDVALQVATLDGGAHGARFRFWNSARRVYVLDGCGAFLAAAGVRVGDALMLARKADGSFLAAGRAAGPDETGKGRRSKRPPAAAPPEARAAQITRKGEPNTDGIFRSAPGADTRQQVHLRSDNVWACVVDLEGEAFQALFDQEADAWEAFHAAAPA